MARSFVPGTQIEIVNEVERGRIRCGLFDFDGTVSLLREGWPGIMGPVMVEMICGGAAPTREIEAEVERVIDETTGVQTIIQMGMLVDMVRDHGLVPEDQILDAQTYKRIYNERLMVPVRERIARLESGKMTAEQATVSGALDFVRTLSERGIALYVFSGTDRGDVRNEAAIVGAAPYFKEIWGALSSIEEYSKEKVIKELIARHDLRGPEVLVVGDGPVEIRNGKEHGCVALGVASDEVKGHGWNEEKRQRLLRAGADILIPDFSERGPLFEYLFPG